MWVLVFGDSITQGFWDTEGGWPNRVGRVFVKEHLKDLKETHVPLIFNLGIASDTSESIAGRVEAETKARGYNELIGVIQAGVNDSRIQDNKPWVAEDEYKANLRSIVEKGLAASQQKVIFIGSSACHEPEVQPVFWANNVHYSNERIKLYEDLMADVAAELNVPFIPVFDEFKKSLDSGQELLTDGLHPNDAGHQLITDIVLPKLQELLV